MSAQPSCADLRHSARMNMDERRSKQRNIERGVGMHGSYGTTACPSETAGTRPGARLDLQAATPAPHRRGLGRVFGVAALCALAGLSAACDQFTDPHQRGESALAQGDYEAALDAFNDAVASGDHLAEAYANRGIANEALSNYDSAVGDYTEALRLFGPDSPDVPEVQNNRGVAFLRLRRNEEAMADFDAAIDADPDYAEAFANRGRAFLDQEDYDAAIEDLDHAIELKVDLAEAYGNRALAFESMGDDEKAIADYSRAIELSHDPQAYFNRGMLRYTLGCFNLAYQDFSTIVEQADESEYLWYMAKSQKDFLEGRPKDADTCSGSERGSDSDAEGGAGADGSAGDGGGDGAAGGTAESGGESGDPGPSPSMTPESSGF
jgi:Tfp pilus assembly protein PilF